MKLNKGMRRDESLNDSIAGSWRYALNLSLSLGTDDIINEDGTVYQDNIGVENLYIGHIKTQDRVIIFSEVLNTDKSEIGVYDGNIYTKLIYSSYFGFDYRNPIKGVFGYNNNNELIIVFTDATQEYPKIDPNVARYLNVDSIQAELDGNLELVTPSDITLFNLFPEYNSPLFNYKDTQYVGGSLLSGVYYYFISYEISDGFFGEWLGASQPIIVHPSGNTETWETIEGAPAGTVTSKAIEITINNLDTRYNRYQIAYLSKINGIYKAGVFATNSTLSNIVVHTGSEIYQDLSMDILLAKNSIYSKVKSLDVLDNNLYLGGLEVDPEVRYQKYANNIKVKWIAIDSVGLDAMIDSYKNPFIVYNKKTFMPGEIYALYGRFHLKNGKTSKLFHIPGRPHVASDIEDCDPDPLTQTDTEAAALDIYPGAKTFHLENTATKFGGAAKYGEMGYWENASESYPDDSEFDGTTDYDENPIAYGVDLRNEHVRHHKFPSLYFLKDTSGGNTIPFLHHNTDVLTNVGSVLLDAPVSIDQLYIGAQMKTYTGNVKVLGFQYGAYTEYLDINNDDFGDYEPLGQSKRIITVVTATQPITVDYDCNIKCSFNSHGGGHKIKGYVQILKRTVAGVNTVEYEVWDTNGEGGAGVDTINITLDVSVVDIVLFTGESLIIRGSCYTETDEEQNPIPVNGGYTGSIKFTARVDVVPSTELATILGLQLDTTSMLFPDEIKDKATYFEILYAKRTIGNSTVLGQAMITTVDTDDGFKYCREHSFDLISTLAALNVTHAERQLNYDYTDAADNTIVYDTDPTDPAFVVETKYGGATPLVKITESKYMQRDNSYISPSNANGEDYIYHRGQFDNGATPTPTNDATDKVLTLANFCSFKLNVYNSMFNQQIVRTNVMINVNSIDYENYNIYGGDCHVSLYGVTRYEGTPVPPAGDNEWGTGSQFHYYLYPCYSVANIGLQHRGKELEEFAFPYFNLINNVVGRGGTHLGEGSYTEGSLWRKIMEANPGGVILYAKDLEQWIGYNFDYSSVNDVEAILPIFDPSLDDIYKFPYRVASSLILASEGQFTGWRIFPSSSYIEMPRDKGPIWNVIADNKDLLVSMKYGLFVFRKKDELNVNDSTVIALGSANLFENKPEEIMYGDNEGYVGNQCMFANDSSLNGIIFVDKERGRIFLYKGYKAKEISSIGMTKWFNTNLKYNITDAPINADYDKNFNEDNPFNGKGILAIWDTKQERYIFNKKANIAFTISYSPNLNYIKDIGYMGGWLCFHSFVPVNMISFKKELYSIKNGTVLEGEVEITSNLIYKHNGNKGLYYGTYYESKIDPIICNPENLNKLFDSIQWATTCKDTSLNPLETTTLSKIIIFTNNKHSDIISLANVGYGTGNTRKIGGSWHFSKFRDVLKTKTSSLITDLNIDHLSYETIPDPTTNKYPATEWYKNSHFKCEYIVVRLVFTNSANKSILIHDFSVNATPRKRF